MFLIPIFACLLATLTFPTQVGAEPQRFSSWFPRYSFALNNLTHDICSAEYAIYKTQALRNATTFAKLEVWDVDSSTTPLINCLVENTPEIYKFAMSSSQVMLGLMPTMLVNVGPTIYETSMLFACGERDILGFLICLGSPSVLFDNVSGFRQQLKEIMESQDNISMDALIGPNIWILWAEYLLVLAAIANLGELCYEIALRTVTSISQNFLFLPATWILVGVATHIFGAFIFAIFKVRSDRTHSRKSLSVLDWVEWARKQFSPARQADNVQSYYLPCSWQELVLCWFTGVLSAINLVWGSMVFSSLLFISIKDAFFIVLRFMASAIVCRAIARYEICAIRGAPRQSDSYRLQQGSSRQQS